MGKWEAFTVAAALLAAGLIVSGVASCQQAQLQNCNEANRKIVETVNEKGGVAVLQPCRY